MNRFIGLLLLLICSSSSAQEDEATYQVQLPWSTANTPLDTPTGNSKSKSSEQIMRAVTENPAFVDPAMHGIVNSNDDDSMESRVLAKYDSTIMSVDTPPGRNYVYPIAAGLPNRIKTNFREVQVIGDFPEDMYLLTEDGNITLQVPGKEVLGIYIREFGMPETAVGLTLFPFDLPQAVIDVNVELPKKMKEKMEANYVKRKETEKIEISLANTPKEDNFAKEYTNKYAAILEKIAGGDDPSGYALLETEFNQPCPLLNSANINHVQKQQYVSSKLIVDILHITNESDITVDFEEGYCMFDLNEHTGEPVERDDVIVVGSYPISTLSPGDEAEVYILRKKEQPHYQKSRRTRLIKE